jgi:L-fuculose-phosphate aldolase
MMFDREQLVVEISRAVLARFRQRQAAKPAPGKNRWAALLDSPEAAKIKDEIVRVGYKLWQRQYADGNGGNISYRLTEEAVICTPTLVSKADLRPEDLVLVDLEGNRLAGITARTSEILLHLAIYRAVPQAKAIVHCHPPHATAYAITGRVPPTGILPEFEVFVGRVAIAPYETPGTQEFAETVLPFIQGHNTVLLSNHGVVCWANTPTRAEWYAEILETYCWTLAIAQQMGAPVLTIPADKVDELMDIKRRLELHDERAAGTASALCVPDSSAAVVADALPTAAGAAPLGRDEIESIVSSVTQAVLEQWEAG